MTDFKKHHTDALRRKLILGGIGVVVLGAYALHRKKVDSILAMSQSAVEETMWASYDEGIKYGLSLAKDFGTVEGLLDHARTGYQQISKVS